MKVKSQIFLTIGLGLTLVVIWLLSLSSLGAPTTRAASYTVCLAGPPTCDYSVIQDAVNAAGDSDMIKVATGTYNDINNIGGHAQVLYISKTLTIRGGYTTTAFTEPPDPAANPTTLNAMGTARVLYITGNVHPVIEGVILTQGDEWNGGGGYIASPASATFSNTVIIDNFAQNGGGLYAEGDLTLINTDVLSNSVNWDGGGVRAGGNLTMNGGRIENNQNSSGNGGGIKCLGSFYMTNSLIINNRSNGEGGGANVDGNAVLNGGHFENNHIEFLEGGGINVGGDLIMTGTVYINNTVEYLGGGARVGGDATLNGGRFEGNASDDLGGGLGVNGNLVMIDTVFVNNTALFEGGGAWVEGGATLIGGIFENNGATMCCGGGLNVGGNLSLTNTVFSDNIAPQNGGGGGANVGGNATLIGGLFENNQSQTGGGISVHLDLSLVDTKFISNTAFGPGGGGGLKVDGDITLNGGLFEGNHSDSHGGGLMLWHGGLTMTGTRFIGNTADGSAGGARINNGATLNGGLFENNRCNGAGGGVYLFDGVLDVNATQFIENSAQSGGGAIFLSMNSTGSVINSLFARNNANNSADFQSHSTGTIDIIHVTFASQPAYTGQAMYIAQSKVDVVNSLFSGYPIGIAGDSLSIVYEDFNLFFQVGAPIIGSTITQGGHSFTGDPKFVDPDQDDYRVFLGGDAVDSGTDAGVLVDFEGDIRPLGEGFDIGFDEFSIASFNTLYLPLVIR